MKTSDVVIIVAWTIGAVSISANLILSNILFNSLKEKYPKYYELLGRPEVNIIGQRNILLHPELRKGQAFVYSLVWSGIPKDFPEDGKLRMLASILRLTVPTMFAGAIAFFIVAAVPTHS